VQVSAKLEFTVRRHLLGNFIRYVHYVWATHLT